MDSSLDSYGTVRNYPFGLWAFMCFWVKNYRNYKGENMNYRTITFETDIQRIRSLKEKLDDVYVDRKTGNIEP